MNNLPAAATRDTRPINSWLLTGLLALVSLALAYGAVRTPYLTSGAVLGLAVITFVLVRPVALIVLMLALGPIDLYWLTGGFKALFPALGGLDANGIRLMAAATGVAVIALVQREVRAAAVSPYGRWFLVFLAYAACTLLISLARLDGLRLYLKLAYPFLTFVVLLGLLRERDQYEKLMTCALIASAIIALVISPATALGGAYDLEGSLRRFKGVSGHENPFSFYLLIMLLVAFTRFLLRGAWIYLGLSGVLAFWIMLTRTRITMLACVIGLTFIVVCVAVQRRNAKTILIGGAVAALIAIPFAPIVIQRSLGYMPTASELLRLMSDPAALFNAINWQGRQLLWAIVWGAFATSPFIGMGLGSSAAVIREQFPVTGAYIPHNEYLRLATETGMIGVMLFFAAIFAWFMGGVRALRQGDQLAQEYAFPLLGGIAAWAIISLTDNAFDYYTQFTQFIGFLAAGTIALTRESKAV